jgi:hypothetical protein
MSDTEAEQTETVPDTATEQENPHAQSVLKLADAMLRATLIFGLGTLVVAVAAFTILYGMPGLLGALVGGAVAFASSLATIGVMRFCASLDPMMVMAIVLGSYVMKVLVLLGLMTLLRGVPALHPYALAITMLAAFIVAAGGEMRAFKRTKIPTIIPASK